MLSTVPRCRDDISSLRLNHSFTCLRDFTFNVTQLSESPNQPDMNVTSSVEHHGDYSHLRLSFYSSTDQSPENPPQNFDEVVARNRKQQEPPRENSRRDVNMLEEQNCKSLDYSSSREFGAHLGSLCGSLSCSRGSLPSTWSWSPGECRVVMGVSDEEC